jgi:hypothetical protein
MNEHPREEEKKMIRTNTKNLFFFSQKKNVLDGMGEKRDEFDTSYSIRIAEERE